MNVVKLAEVASVDTVETLQFLLRQARRGKITGMAYTYQQSNNPHPVVGLTGRYRNEEYLAIGVVSYMLRELHLHADEVAGVKG